ncbi:hypothetical protein [Fibrobacter sp.]|uniref:hypothetical protein n=1 Tax=Fibrobacter sp. TaxID=35828 RepID=UPI0038697953
MNKLFILIPLAASMCFGARIGVLKNTGSCPGEQVLIDLDVEDSHNHTGVKNNTDPNPPGITLGGHAKFTYCVLNVNSLTRVPYSYFVLRLGNKCPTGSYAFSHHHDTEDTRNRNSHSGNISPSVVNDNATLEYCYVPKNDTSKVKYPVDIKYGVFSRGSSKINKIAHSEIFIDDEDSNNSNGDEFHFTASDLVSQDIDHSLQYPEAQAVYNFMMDIYSLLYSSWDDLHNTTYHVIKWTGTANDLKKSSVVDESMPMVAAVPTAPAVKGLNRSLVSVELKSAGDVKVSVVGVNGAVLANVSEKNLQPGDHQIKWNSGMVPSGRYIVKIEQNGMVNAKNVILK